MSDPPTRSTTRTPSAAPTSEPATSWLLPATDCVTVGLPFCVFKVLTGIVALQVQPLVAVGYGLIALGFVDAALNILNLSSLILVHRRVSGVCVADVVVRRFAKSKASDDLGLAVDVFLSFTLVAIVIGGGLLPRLPRWAVHIWDVAVVFNVLGAGAGRLLAALRRREAGNERAS